MTVLSVQQVGKAFRAYRSEWHRFARWFGLPVKPAEEVWVLRHISFDIRPGEAIGIIGQNGAGKSTLLKIITGTLQPTEGRIQVNGRIAAILELGMGFNPELTGRQNVRHAAGLMGFSREQIEVAMPQIEAFAEIGDYFDEPMRIYSSGMQMRVAFAVATAWRPEILIVDEALSVGDVYFQHKSFDRIRAFREQGTTLLIVSHDRSAIQSLCDRAILLEHGHVIKDGDPEEVFDFYNALIAEKENSTVEVKKLDNGKAQTTSGTGEARVEEIALYNSKGEVAEYVGVGEPVELRVKVKVHQPVETLVLGYSIKDRLGQVMYGTNTWHTNQVIHNPQPGDEYLFVIAFPANFGVGSYSVQTALVDRDTHLTANYEWRDMALLFNVINIDKTQFVGCMWNEPKITFEKIAP
ncbi:ABC transporter ATP-binding protein [Tepidiphilus baoligensis]|uniref:ATP-binding cassette domain-containing protein n=1 Tax=Tepidiphilus baoligensis TaxID=2698687 RepID=A0ABX1QMJ2_9PROT|nr:ABC transporter ATP-binding protein [Tepidiphilus baoligensis]NMH16646.1 ATP-binding cassette domain-containing protein [Tepidiphilus baoligensis]